MKNLLCLLTVTILLVAPLGAIAQEEEEPEAYIMATYFYCNTGREEAADAVVESKMAPIYDQAVADGTITSWGWLHHVSGGQWRRVLYHAAIGLDNIMSASETIYAATDEAVGDDGAFDEACPRHDDYMWTSTTVGSGNERGDAGLSVYFICDEGKEDQADSIVETVWKPVYDQLVADGKLASWGWSSHFLGGKYRRLLTTTADSHLANLNARNEAIEAVFDNGPMGRVFTEACNGHADYLWDVAIETP